MGRKISIEIGPARYVHLKMTRASLLKDASEDGESIRRIDCTGEVPSRKSDPKFVVVYKLVGIVKPRKTK
jgi:hypothetical protein